MLRKTLSSLLLFLLLPVGTGAVESTDFFVPNIDFKTTTEVMDEIHPENTTNCASAIFSKALSDNADKISVDAPEDIVRAWAKNTMLDASVLKKVVECDEIKSVSEDTTVIFTPIVYEFPDSVRTITINYSTQPRVLKQHLLLATKRSLPNGDPNPKLMDPNDPAKYLNTEPAWYAIMVVQHDSLSEFVGPGKNNTVSVKYIADNIKNIYPRGYRCTSKSAITSGNNYDTINKVVHEVVDIKDDSNDYYVAGDVNLEWVMYAEIAADVIITVATWGGGAVLSGALKGARATKTSKNLINLIKSMKVLTKTDDVKNYINITRKITQHSDDIVKLEKNIEHAEKYEKLLKNAETARKAGRAQDVAKYEKEAKEILEAAQKVDPKTTANTLKNADKLKDQKKKAEDALDIAKSDAKKLEETNKNVKQYKETSETLKETSETLTDLMKYRRELRGFRRPHTGNIFVRNLKKIIEPLKASKTGAEKMTKAARVARKGMSSRSAKFNSWLFDTTLKHGSRLAKFESKVGLLYGAASFLGDMYDQTSATSKEFSNGIEFKPLCLLSADDLEGQENVVNYGMWLMWEGNSTDPADDDAAYLEAMDFASKFYYRLDEYQDKHGANCNVDIYVVHPIIRLDETNVDDPHGEMFYLFMNEIPWTTADQIGNIEDWERTQQQLETTDPDGKYKIAK